MPFYFILPLLFSFFQADSTLLLQKDIEKDFAILQKSHSYFINDNSISDPSLETVATNLQLFLLAASLDLSKASHTSKTTGKHQVQSWRFSEGEIKAIHQIESMVKLDTVVTQHYLENRPPTQHRITNNFTFRAYVVATATHPVKLYYLTEAAQGLLKYKIENRQVAIGYGTQKEGLQDILPKYEQELKQVLKSIN